MGVESSGELKFPGLSIDIYEITVQVLAGPLMEIETCDEGIPALFWL